MTTEGTTELVVVGVDGSPASAMAMAWTARYAKAMGARVRAVLAWHYPVTAGAGAVSVPPTVITDDVERTRREDLDKAIAATFGDPPPVAVESVVVYGHPAQVLLEQSRDADLLVVGSRGHGGFSGMLLGSVSTHCVTHATCPVTVVRTS